MARHWVYILRCADGTLYTGCTTDLEKRVERHNSGRGAKYTRARLPVTLAYYEGASSLGRAVKRESEIKKLSRSAKLLLCSAARAGSADSVR